MKVNPNDRNELRVFYRETADRFVRYSSLDKSVFNECILVLPSNEKNVNPNLLKIPLTLLKPYIDLSTVHMLPDRQMYVTNCFKPSKNVNKL